MTFKEQLINDYPWLYAESVAETIKEKCPSELGFISRAEEDKLCKEVKCDCKKCWNSEVPNTEPKTDMDKEDYYNVGYIKGLEDAWELAKKLHTMTSSNLVTIYGFSKPEYVLDKFAFTEAIAKLKAYEEQRKIVRGDVIKTINGECEYLVTRIEWSGRRILHVMNLNNGTVQTMTCDVKKTGKHIDIKSFLEQIGE